MSKKQRLILKLSGEYLSGEKGFGFDQKILNQLVDDILEIKDLGHEIAIVLGGGNFFRGKDLSEINRAAADNVGMLATIQNALVVSETIKLKGHKTAIYSSFPIDKIAKYFTYSSADKALTKGKICFLAGGTGNPFFTTDTAAVLRAIELNCDIVLKGTNVDGIYTADPKKDNNAEFISEITFTETLSKQLKIMDMTAFSLAREYNIPIKIFNISVPGNIKKALLSKNIGSYVAENITNNH